VSAPRRGDRTNRSHPLPADLTAATSDEITEALSYALRYDARGKPQPTGYQMVASFAAERLMEHLHLAGFVLTRQRPAPSHSAG
jgi:hypothetical protein